jgi:hypothetical protein
MMRKMFFLVLCMCVSIASVTVAQEHAIGVRPANLFFSHNRGPATIADGTLDQIANFGWGSTVGTMADFDGDGLDDKVLYQSADDGSGNFGWQTIVAYTDTVNGFLNTNNDIIGIADWSWLNVGGTADVPIYGDVDGDGIADNGITADGATVGGSAGALTWGAFRSAGVPGLASGVNFTNYNAFGIYGQDTPLMGDINGDGFDDRILFRNDFNTYVDYSDPNTGNYGDSSVDTQSVFGGVAGDEIAIADINGDGFDDVVVIREDVPGNHYDLFAYYSSAAGLSDGSAPDLLGAAGFLDEGDYIVFGDITPAPANYSLAERVSLYRPVGSPHEWYAHANTLADGGFWADAIDKTGNHGWTGVTPGWADFTGDGIDDSIVWQPAGVGQQIIAAWSGADGSLTNGDWGANGDIILSWNWGDPNFADSSNKMPLFGDIDGDGIDDNCVATSDYDQTDGAGDPDVMVWGGWLSAGFTGIPDGSRGNPVVAGTWSSFGVYSLGDVPHLGDINGDGYADRILYRTTTSEVFVDYSVAGGWGDSVVDAQIALGIAGDELGVTDINGDGYDDLVVIRPNVGGDYYDLYGYYTDPAVVFGNINGASPDAQTGAGTISFDDVILFAQLDPNPGLQADLDDDGDVDIDDLKIMTGEWLNTSSIASTNGSFENPVLADGQTVKGDPNDPNSTEFYDWGNYLGDVSDAEIRNPDAGFTLQAAEGDNYLFIGDPGGSAVTQVTEFNVAPNSIYNVTASVGSESGSGFGWYWIYFTAFDPGLGTFVEITPGDIHLTGVNQNTGGTYPPEDDWVDIAFTLDTTDPTYAVVVGTDLQLFLDGTNVAYDNIVIEKISSGDIDGDGVVSLPDFAILAEEWLLAL